MIPEIHHGDLFDVLPTLAENSIDAMVTDPPYGIGFMGREWDTFKPGVEESRIVKNTKIDSDNPNLKGRTRGPASSPSAVEYDRSLHGQRAFQDWTAEWAAETFRVLKPGAYVVVFGAPRSYHRMASGLEDAGFVIRDTLAWMFGQGFPKSMNLGDGLGTALKPAFEPITLAWKPFKGTTTACHAEFGTAALAIDECRVGFASEADRASAFPGGKVTSHGSGSLAGPGAAQDATRSEFAAERNALGRWPSNVLLDELAAAALDAQTGMLRSGANPTSRNTDKFRGVYSAFEGQKECEPARGADAGGASRFFYCAKPSRRERDMGCEHLGLKTAGECTDRKEGSAGLNNPRAGAGRTGGGRNSHPTVKPVNLMRYLVKLITPKGGTVLDPFTGMACCYEDRNFVGIEREAEYVDIAWARIGAADMDANGVAA